MADQSPNKCPLPWGQSASHRLGQSLALLLACIPLLGLTTESKETSSAFRSPPGAEPLDAALQKKLAETLKARGPDYQPRTRNLGSDGAPIYSNRLLLEASPYLQQHAHNPVNWYPWGDEAFATARRRGVPVLVSIGYSTCHWCHVMEEESFDDPETAEYLNANFVAIKVDREARPDVDAVYMSAVQAMGIDGGWPLNVWVTPDRTPFFGGTYFPPVDQRGRPGFKQILKRIHEQYAENPERFRAHAQAVARELSLQLAGRDTASSSSPKIADLEATFRRYEALADDDWGGLRQRVKFPSSLPIPLLLRWHRRSGDPRALDISARALDAMASGGIHDQLAGGFHRYSTDERWLLPHFEKMLYDQALLSNAYLEGWQQSGNERFANITRSILDYVQSELGAPSGAFYSATDADSVGPGGEMEEGFYFTWTPDEVDAILGPSVGSQFRLWYGVSAAGDVDGRSVLRTWKNPDELAAELEMPSAQLIANIEAANRKMLSARGQRPAPLRDDKIIAAWNGLAISAFARAGFVLNQESYLGAARAAATFVLDQMRVDGRLRRIWLQGKAAGPAFLSDYAFMIAGLLDLYEASPDIRWIDEAIALQEVLDTHYADPMGGYFRTADDSEALLVREKPFRDGAIPSGNSVEALNLLRLASLTGDDNYQNRGLQILSSRGDAIRKSPTNASELLLALDFALDTPKEILLIKGPNGDANPLVDVLRKSFVPNRVISIVDDGAERDAHASRVPLLRYKTAQKGRSTAYVCENRICKKPTSDPEVLKSQLKSRPPKP